MHAPYRLRASVLCSQDPRGRGRRRQPLEEVLRLKRPPEKQGEGPRANHSTPDEVPLPPPATNQVLSARRSGQAVCKDSPPGKTETSPGTAATRPETSCYLLLRTPGHLRGSGHTARGGTLCPRRPVSLSKNYLNKDSLRTSLELPQSPLRFSGPAPPPTSCLRCKQTSTLPTRNRGQKSRHPAAHPTSNRKPF